MQDKGFSQKKSRREIQSNYLTDSGHREDPDITVGIYGWFVNSHWSKDS